MPHTRCSQRSPLPIAAVSLATHSTATNSGVSLVIIMSMSKTPLVSLPWRVISHLQCLLTLFMNPLLAALSIQFALTTLARYPQSSRFSFSATLFHCVCNFRFRLKSLATCFLLQSNLDCTHNTQCSWSDGVVTRARDFLTLLHYLSITCCFSWPYAFTSFTISPLPLPSNRSMKWYSPSLPSFSSSPLSVCVIRQSDIFFQTIMPPIYSTPFASPSPLSLLSLCLLLSSWSSLIEG